MKAEGRESCGELMSLCATERFRLFSFGISDGRAYSMFHVPTCAQRSSPKFSQVFRQCSDHFSDQFGDQFGDPFSDQFSDQLSNQFPNQCFRKLCGHGCGQGWGRVFWTRFRGQGEVFGRRFACNRIAEFSLEWQGDLMVFLWLEGSERRSVKAC